MLDVGFLEMVVVFVIALLVLGPERLPRVARGAGLWLGRARAMFYSVRSELERELRVEEMRKAGYELKDNLELEEIRKLRDDLDTTARDPGATDAPNPVAPTKKEGES